MNLVPKYTYNYDALWSFLNRRNLWFIKIRYLAVLALVILYVFLLSVPQLRLNTTQIVALPIISFSVLFYNISFRKIYKNLKFKPSECDVEKFNPLHFALIQIIFDIVALYLITYFTGNIESPFALLFILHGIIGSMILPGPVVFLMFGVLLACFFTISVLEYYGVFFHYSIVGLYEFPLYDNPYFLLIYSFVFMIMIFGGIFFANTIAHELYKREQDLKLALDKLNEAEIAKQKYTMGIVHEIKSPIVAVQSYLDLIIGKFLGPVSPVIEERIQKARKRSDEAIQIINDVLQISKLKLLDTITKEETDIEEIISYIIEQKKISADAKNIMLFFSDKRTYLKKIMGDRELLRLALSNLIGNSVKYTNNGGKIEIILYSTFRETIIEICDDGIGIPQDELKNVFRDFYRSSLIRQKGIEGTGLGLTLVKQIIDTHNGKITVQSPSRLSDNVGPGTTFRIYLRHS